MNSLILATYNGEKFLESQLESILRQTIRPDEVIIRDDCSKDRTVDVVKSFINRYDLDGVWHLVQNENNQGYVLSFWESLLMTHGDIVFLCDQDDVWLPNKIERMAQIIKTTGAWMLHSEINIIDENDKVIAFRHERIKAGITHYKLSRYLRTMHYCGMSSALSAEVREYARKLDPSSFPTHDWMLGLIAALYGKFYTTNEVFTLRRYHGGNVALTLKEAVVRNGIDQRLRVIDHDLALYAAAILAADRLEVPEFQRNILRKFYDVCISRREAVEKRSLLKIFRTLRRLSYYPTVKSCIGDLLYILSIF